MNTFGAVACVLIAHIIGRSDGSACEFTCGSSMDKTRTQDYCNEQQLKLQNRCCYHTSANLTEENVVGVDLQNCNLTSITGLFENMTALVIISLEDNPLTGVKADDFYHLTSLEYLSLPMTNASTQCPGGEDAWKSTNHSSDILLCQNQSDTCLNIKNNGTCPHPQSFCVPAGPGLVDCLCSPGYHGYKCLRQGTFSTAAFVGGLGASTVVLTAVLWVTQRRHVKKNN